MKLILKTLALLTTITVVYIGISKLTWAIVIHSPVPTPPDQVWYVLVSLSVTTIAGLYILLSLHRT